MHIYLSEQYRGAFQGVSVTALEGLHREGQGRDKSSNKLVFLPLIQNIRRQYILGGFPVGSDSILESSFTERIRKPEQKEFNNQERNKQF